MLYKSDLDFRMHPLALLLTLLCCVITLCVLLLILASTDVSDSTTLSTSAAASVVKAEPELKPVTEPATIAIETMKERKERKWKMRDRTGNWKANYVSGINIVLDWMYNLTNILIVFIVLDR